MNVTAIIVSYMREDLLCSSFESIRKFYSEMPVIIIDGSPFDSVCAKYAESLRNEFTIVRCTGYNIGHGNGMALGIEYCKTGKFLLVDSDVIIRKAVISQMEAALCHWKAYGVGQVVLVNDQGGNIDTGGIPYLHPHFALIDKRKYIEYQPFIHHGAPCIKSMLDIKGKELLLDFNVSEFITHLGRGTRVLNPREFSSKFWDK